MGLGGVNMYAVIETGGKQYRVQEGDSLFVEKLECQAGDSVELDKVLLVPNEGNITVGKPYVDGVSVSAKVLENGKARKVVIYKYKAKKDYRKKQGHRQPYTKIEIQKINA